MNDLEQYKEHIECTFAAFCKIVLRNASLSAYRDIGRRKKREISLDYLMKERCYNPSATDSYFAEQTSSKELIVCDEKIIIENERLAKVFPIYPSCGRKFWYCIFSLDIRIRKSERCTEEAVRQ